jgi:hypothetical protein
MRRAYVLYTRYLLLVLGYFATTATVRPAQAQHGPYWEATETVDAPVPAMSSPSGTPLIHAPQWAPWNGADRWHVVYVKGGEINQRMRGPEGWQEAETLTSSAVYAQDPQAAFAQDRLLVVWVDGRVGHDEVWSRRWDGVSWSAEECLSDDAVPSTAAVLAGNETGALVVWQDEIPGHRTIRGRAWSSGSLWGPVVEISQSPAEAFHPVLSAAHAGYWAAWSDTRDGHASIYLRAISGGESPPPFRATNLAGTSDYPVLQHEICCGDNLSDWFVLLLQNDCQGVNEIYRSCVIEGVPQGATRLSPNDGIPSVRPSLTGFIYELESGPAYFTSVRSFGTWTDELGETAQHPLYRLDGCTSPDDLGFIGGPAVSHAIMASFPSRPYAALANLWIEEREGVPTLLFRPGTALSCWHVRIDAPGKILIAPEGVPVDTFAIMNYCRGTRPVPDVSVGLVFDAALNNRLRWDAAQPHPDLPETVTGEDGLAVFSIRGGGCSSTGTALLEFNGIAMWSYTGAASPDVNGDCMVRADDLLYVQSKLGTTDFCADLDGNGLVEAADVALVEATLGDVCSQITGVEPVSPQRGRSAVANLRVRPNPCSGGAVLGLDLSAPDRTRVLLFDAGGRVVRDLGERISPAGTSSVPWDGRDDNGNAVPSGVYFVLLQTGAQGGEQEGSKELRRMVLVVR